MNSEKAKQNLIYLKDYIIFILLLFCCMMPLFRQFTYSLKYSL